MRVIIKGGGKKINAKLDRVLLLLEQLVRGQSTFTQEITVMAGELDRLTQEVTESTTVQQSAITLLNQLSELIRQSATDPVALGALADSLDSNATALAAAVEANTPPTP